MTRDAPQRRMLDCVDGRCKPEQTAAASPVTYIDRSVPPMLLIVGNQDKDRAVPADSGNGGWTLPFSSST